MKKILYLLLISGGLLAASCTKRYEEVVHPNQTLYVNLSPSDWTTADTSKNYTATVTPQTGSDFGAGSDGVLIYFTFDGGNTYEQIPEVYNNVSFSYTVTRGVITLYAQSANGAQTISAPVALKAKIILVPSD
jgi:hypothetical protein